MGTTWFIIWSVWIFLCRAAAAYKSPCQPGFESEMLILRVSKKALKQGTRLGKVVFTDCTGRTQFLLSTDDSHFVVEPDGIITVNRQAVLHEGNQNFSVHAWESQGQKMTLLVRLLYQEHHYMNNHLDAEFCHEAHKLHDQLDSDRNQQDPAGPQIPVLDLIKSSPRLKRRKREWFIPSLSIAENFRGPFPMLITQIRSDGDKVKRIYYSITGPGADQPPVGLFTMDRDTGRLYVTQGLDREKQDKYWFKAHAAAAGSATSAEESMDIIINVIDQNDNKPVFNQSTYVGEVPEAAEKGLEVIQVVATDADEPNTGNSDLRYRILSQRAEQPSPNMFTINPRTGVIRVNEAGLDREKIPQYELEVQAADMQGEGFTGRTRVIIKVTDSKNHALVFAEPFYSATVEENKVDALVVKMLVTDGDDPHTAAWNAKFSIIDGDPGNLFTVKTGANKQEGIITTAKGLDFERTSKHTLLVTVVNEAPFVPSVSLVTSTATVVVTVEDVDEPPIFESEEKLVSKSENLTANSLVVLYTASDPDTSAKQKVMYKIISDPAGWLGIDKETGVITVRNQMDRESSFVKEDKYTALIGAYDDDQISATGTATLIIKLEDVNDNAPIIDKGFIKVCNKKPAPQLLTVTDKDGPGFTSPYSVSLHDPTANWIARMNDNRTAIILTLNRELENGNYAVAMSVSDNQGLSQVSTVKATVCDCTGEQVTCQKEDDGDSNQSVILAILKGILMLLFMLGLPFFLFVRRRRAAEKPVEFNNVNVKDMFEEEKMDDRTFSLEYLNEEVPL